MSFWTIDLLLFQSETHAVDWRSVDYIPIPAPSGPGTLSRLLTQTYIVCISYSDMGSHLIRRNNPPSLAHIPLPPILPPASSVRATDRAHIVKLGLKRPLAYAATTGGNTGTYNADVRRHELVRAAVAVDADEDLAVVGAHAVVRVGGWDSVRSEVLLLASRPITSLP